MNREKTVFVRKPANICIVTQELYGWNEPSDASAGILALAQEFGRLGNTVTLLWIPPFADNRRPSPSDLQKLQNYYFSNFLIRLQVISTSKDVYPVLYKNQLASAEVYYFIKSQTFDIIYFALEGGLGYYTIVAKELGLISSVPALVVLAQSPLLWKAEADHRFLQSMDELAIVHMEKHCAEMADLLLSPSSYLLKWMEKSGWALPRTSVISNEVPKEWDIEEEGCSDSVQAVKELVFLSGCEFRHGLTLFCDALDHLSTQQLPPLTITVLGRFGRILGEHTGSMILRRGRRWPFEIRLLPRLTDREAMAYLKNRGCLAVITNLAANAPMIVSGCLKHKIPFVATNVGGTPELVPAALRDAILCAPKPKQLASKIVAAVNAPPNSLSVLSPNESTLVNGVVPPDLEQMPNKATQKAIAKEQPLVSIIMAHHDRAEYLPQAVAAIEQQDYANIELIIVDDGSTKPDSLALLHKLQAKFVKRGWRILYQENRYLGAARNAGIQIARGSLILFVDDDNALFEHAVSTFVRCLTNSNADICTAFYRSFHDAELPSSKSHGHINYLPLGGSIDLALIVNPFGDANAMIRRDVFDKIGYQIEDYGYTAQDWEFFTRAALAGLKIRVIPEPLYWYRSRPEGMFRSSHWYDNRLPIINAFRKHNYSGLHLLYHLPIAQNVETGEQESLHHNLNYNMSNERMARLRDMDPNSDACIELLAEIAASEGRGETSVILLGHINKSEFRQRALDTLSKRSPAETALAESGREFISKTVLGEAQLRNFQIRAQHFNGNSMSYIEAPDKIYLKAQDGNTSIAVLAAGCPTGTISASIMVFQDQAIATPTEFLLVLSSPELDPHTAIRCPSSAVLASSGWCLTTRPYEVRTVEAELKSPSSTPLNLIIAVRAKRRKTSKVLGCFSQIKYKQVLGNLDAPRPRFGQPPNVQRARELDSKALRSAKLVTNYPSDRPLLLFPPKGDGLFLRPSQRGNVVASLPWQFPAFARKLIGLVEVAHEEASTFEFAMALTRPESTVKWTAEKPEDCVGFSGWMRVEQKFEYRKLLLEMDNLVMHPLTINLAIRVPRGSSSNPSNAYWRKLLLSWDE
jgi:glycosyltransferase involved in cell wall biosynthesis